MCGITGWIDWEEDMTQQQPILKQMAAKLHLRGPDQTNIWCSQRAGFGHTRLIVVDPVGGQQPMIRYKGENQYVLVYNGELYNTEDIRQELLAHGYSFHGHSDTEVLLTAYLQWGADCVDRLNGIFAFGIWDQHNQHLLLARDRLGVKPLFYREERGSLLFSSEIKAILAHPRVEAVVDEEGLAEVFGLGPSRTPGHGIFQGIKELRPGHSLSYSQMGQKIRRYWQLESKPHTDDLKTTTKRVHDLFKDAVTRQLVADVPVCTLLSGGLDSSAITAFAAEGLNADGRGQLHTYSIDYQDNDQFFQANEFQPNADGPWIETMTKAYQTNHHRLVINTNQLVDYLQQAMIVRDQPGMADVDSSLLWFCQQIKSDATVALSGECADEIFGGYPWFHDPTSPSSSGFPWMRSTLEREELLLPEWKQRLAIPEYVADRYTSTLAEVPKLPGESSFEARRRELFYLNIIWFMTALLDRKDRMSMGASLEVRVPFADHRLVEYVWNIPWKFKTIDNREKGILRRALVDVLPDQVLHRKKSPYPKTHNPSYTKAVSQWLSDIISNPEAPLLQIVSKKKLQRLLDTEGRSFTKPWFGQLMTGPQLIAYLAQINTWLSHYHIRIK